MRLIDADALKEWAEEYHTSNWGIPQDELIYAIGSAPTIEPKRGKWIKDGVRNALYKCSACNDLCTVAGWANCIPEEQMYKSFKFCPNCGARMEGSEE